MPKCRMRCMPQYMEQEAAHELVDGDGGGARLLLPWLLRLSVPEGGGLAVEGGDAAVGDGDPVCISGQVSEHLLRSPEGLFGIDHPVPAAGEGGVEPAGVGEMGDVAVEDDLALAPGRVLRGSGVGTGWREP